MQLFISLLTPIQKFNDICGYIGSRVSAMALALMVVVILLQVFFRYVIINTATWRLSVTPQHLKLAAGI